MPGLDSNPSVLAQKCHHCSHCTPQLLPPHPHSSSICQSTGGWPDCASSLFVAEKWRHPRKPCTRESRHTPNHICEHACSNSTCSRTATTHPMCRQRRRVHTFEHVVLLHVQLGTALLRVPACVVAAAAAQRRHSQLRCASTTDLWCTHESTPALVAQPPSTTHLPHSRNTMPLRCLTSAVSAALVNASQPLPAGEDTHPG